MSRTADGTDVRRAGFRTLVRDLFSFDRKTFLILVYVPLALVAMATLIVVRHIKG